MPNDQPRTHLPDGVPESVRDFVRTPEAGEIDIEAGDLDWLPKPDTGDIPVPDVTPELTFDNGPTPGTVEISVGWGFLKITLTASIEDGKLSVTPPGFPGLGQEVTDWVNDFNADLETNGLQLSEVSIVDGKLHLEKDEAPAVVEETSSTATPAPVAATPAPQAAATTPPVAPVPTPTKGSKTEAFLNEHGKKAAAVGVLAIAAAAFFLFVDDEPAVPPPPAGAQVTATQDAASSGSTDEDSGSDSGSTSDADTGSGSDSVGQDAAGSDSGTSDSSDDAPAQPGSDTSQEDPLGAFHHQGLEDFASTMGGGTLVLLQPDAANDQNFCGQSDAIGADMTGVTVTQDGDTVTVGVAFSQSPAVSQGDFSWATLVQVSFAAGVDRMFVAQIHDGQITQGEQDAFGAPIEGSDVQVTMTDKGVYFTFSILPGDTVQHAAASGFNLRTADDSIGCDQAYGSAHDLPLPPSDTTGGCEPSDTVLCLNDRFSVAIDWNDGSATGTGEGVAVSQDTGAFWFFAPNTYELLVRVVNACDFDGHYWVFASATTDVEYTLSVTDSATDQAQEFVNALGNVAEPIVDTMAFATCP